MRALVVGLGLAGAWTAWFLRDAGVAVTVVDPLLPSTCSRVAAGLINPITGRRLHTTWRGQEVTRTAFAAYASVEHKHGVQIVRHLPLRRVFRDADMARVFDERQATDEFDWLHVQAIASGDHDGVAFPYGGYAVDAATVDTTAFLDVMRSDLDVVQDTVDDAWLLAHADRFDVIVWCNGWIAARHPLWSWLPFAPVKGEILDVHVPGLDVDHIIASNIWLIPMGDERYRLGSTYDWDDLTDTPTDQARATLTWQAERLLGRRVIVEAHRAGIRPASHTRRPYVGRHPADPRHVLCNGLGTKGSLLAPWTAQQLVRNLVFAEPLDQELDIMPWWNT